MAEENIDVRVRLLEQRVFNRDAKQAATSVRGVGKAATDVEKSSRRAQRSIGGLRGSFNTLGGSARLLVGGVGATLGLYGISRGLSTIYEEGREAIKTGKATNQVIKTTGGAANITAAEVASLATQLSNKSAIDDEQIQKGMNLLLTFRGIRNEAGKGNDIFNQTSQAALDMSAAMTAAGKNMSVTDAMLQLGKAINDPEKGMKRLTRVGVTFTKQQEDQVDALIKSGDRVGAQRVIIDELNKEFGGMAISQADPMQRLSVILHNLAETVGVALIPYLDKGAKWLGTFIMQMTEGEGAGGRFVDKVKSIFDVIKGLVSWGIGADKKIFGWLRDTVGDELVAAFEFLRKVAVAAPGAITGAWNTAVNWIRTAATNVRNWLVGAFEWVRSALGLTGADMKQFGAAVVNVARMMASRVALYVKVMAGVFLHVILPVVRRVIPALVSAIRGGLRIIGGIIKVFTGIFTGDWRKAWDGLKQIVSGALEVLYGVLRAATAPIRDIASKMFGGIKSAFKAVYEWIAEKIEWIVDKITWATDKLDSLNPFGGDTVAGGGGLTQAQIEAIPEGTASDPAGTDVRGRGPGRTPRIQPKIVGATAGSAPRVDLAGLLDITLHNVLNVDGAPMARNTARHGRTRRNRK